jgi:hypothetical protein
VLIEFSGRNFGCFRDEFRLSLLATDIDPGADRGIVEVNVAGDDQPLRLLRCAALYGPNASGKSTFLRAAGALSRLIAETARLSSNSALDAYEPFALGPQSKQPVTLAVKAVIDGEVYDYSISFDRLTVVAERLILWRSDGSQVTLFGRERQDVNGTWKADPQFQLVTKKFRPNALLLSLADSLTPSLAKGIAVALRSLLRYADPDSRDVSTSGIEVAIKARASPAFNDWLLAILKTADVGIVDVGQIRPDGNDALLYHLHAPFHVDSADEVRPTPVKQRDLYKLRLLHGSEPGPTPLPYDKESLGTKRLVAWSPLLYGLTHGENPQAVFADEFDASMHPTLLNALVGHFNGGIPKEQVRGQLVFAAHETSLLDDEAKDAVLRRDQVYFTEKDASGAARLFSLAEFRERNNLNIRRRYLQGRYGALPALGTFTE